MWRNQSGGWGNGDTKYGLWEDNQLMWNSIQVTCGQWQSQTLLKIHRFYLCMCTCVCSYMERPEDHLKMSFFLSSLFLVFETGSLTGIWSLPSQLGRPANESRGSACLPPQSSDFKCVFLTRLLGMDRRSSSLCSSDFTDRAVPLALIHRL